MRQEKTSEEALKWVIFEVKADFLDFLVPDTIMLRFLPPTSDELDFLELRRALSDSTHLDSYAHQEFGCDPLSVFFFLIFSGELTFQHVQTVEYIVRDIPGNEFILHYYNRSSQNSGWMIRELKRVP